MELLVSDKPGLSSSFLVLKKKKKKGLQLPTPYPTSPATLPLSEGHQNRNLSIPGKSCNLIGLHFPLYFSSTNPKISLSFVHTKLLQQCPTLCNLLDCSPPGSSIRGILQARILQWVTVPSSRGSYQPRDRTQVSCGSCIAGGFFTTEPLRKSPHCSKYELKKSLPQLCKL